MPKTKAIRRTLQARSRSHLTDAMGQGISPESLREGIAAWNELWKSGKFDCGPQDYDGMAKEILQSIGVTESNLQSGVIECPHCGRDCAMGEVQGEEGEIIVSSAECSASRTGTGILLCGVVGHAPLTLHRSQ